MNATYISSTSFSVSGDQTSEFVLDRKVRAYCGADGYKYCTVESSVYSNPSTTVVVSGQALTANLVTVLFGIVSPGAIGSQARQRVLGCIDFPASFSGQAGKSLKVNSGESAVEFSTDSIDAGVGISFEAADKPKTSGVYALITPYAMTLPANLTGSTYYGAVNPTAQVVVSLQKNGVEFGTLTVATNGTPTFAAASPVSLAAGDRVTWAFPTQDATWAGVAITLKGTRTV